MAIRELVDCPSAGADLKAIKFANALSFSLRLNNDFRIIERTAESLGHMAKFSPVSLVDYIEIELERSLEWLWVDKKPHRQVAACYVLQQLAENAPTIFFARISDFFKLIWEPLRDPNEQIRAAAGKSFSACLAVLEQVNATSCMPCITQLYPAYVSFRVVL